MNNECMELATTLPTHYTLSVMVTKQIFHLEGNQIIIAGAKWCNSFGTKLRGFTFRRVLAREDGLVLVEKSDSKMNTSIHMLFVFFDLGVIWVNDKGVVVDTAVAKKWRLSYVPQAPARYVIEGHPSLVDIVQVGDHIEFRGDAV
jgi:uncharacterized membrane protein (UPF0127 family)